jgi:hypothetical protein
MRRDMGLIRLLLLEQEGHEAVDLSDYTEEQQVYHAALLIDAGLLRGGVLHDAEKKVTGVMIVDVTWAGHDFLAAARSAGIWAKAMTKVKTAGVDVSLTLLKELLTQYAKDAIGL